MKRLPEIGERVCYKSKRFPERTTIGTVRKLYPGDRCDEDDTDIIEPVRVGDPEWEEYWSASVEVDERPSWWQYGENPRFAPSLDELEPMA